MCNDGRGRHDAQPGGLVLLMRVGITGADGFTGVYLLDVLAARGAIAVPLMADLRDPTAVALEIAAARIDRLVHLAGIAFVASDDWAQFYAVNQIGTFTLLDAVARVSPGIRCVLASSAQVYGAQASGIISEDHPVAPSNHYAISKYAMELGSHQWRDRLEIVITRPFNYTGLGQEARYLIPKIVDHLKRRASVIELGNLDVKRDFGDVRSVTEAYTALVLGEETPPPVVNLCSGAVYGLRDVVSMASEIAGHQLDIRVNPDFVRANDVPVLGGDPGRLAATLPGWSPIALRDTLTWMIEANSA